MNFQFKFRVPTRAFFQRQKLHQLLQMMLATTQSKLFRKKKKKQYNPIFNFLFLNLWPFLKMILIKNGHSS